MPNEEEMRYEALATLIASHHEENKQRHKAFASEVDRRFAGLEHHNRKQNGAIQESLKRIAIIEQESATRGATCKVVVEAMEKNLKYAKLIKWVDKHPKISIVVLVVLIFTSTGVIHAAIEGGWVLRIIEIIKP